MKRIEICEITELESYNEVDVMYNDGSVEMIFVYCPDKVVFNEREFIGLTEAEADDLVRRRCTVH
jgi:hypothetical protein